MSKYRSTDILVIGLDKREIANFRSSLNDEFIVTLCEDLGNTVNLMMQRAIRVSVVLADGVGKEHAKLLRMLRTTFFQEPVQIIAGVKDDVSARKALEMGADDTFLIASEDPVICIQAAVQRLRLQIRVFGNLEFFKKAAKEEEELSAKILDRHMVLKEAFQNVESINQELEETNKQLEKIARYDTLSGLLNRTSLFTAMDTEIDRAIRTKAKLSGIMIDIDNFKTINDTYGHLHGDRVIAEIGRRLQAMLRKYDLAGRYGGEEFFIILPNSVLHQAYLIAERFRKRLVESPFDLSGHAVVVTASFGIAELRETESRESWISRCDMQLYRAKAAGRNRVSGR
jgi:diguanylate cyclase (GGDEF)-like protein